MGVIGTGGIGTIGYLVAGFEIDLEAAIAMAIGAMVTANVGANLVRNMSPSTLQFMYGILQLGTGPMVLYKDEIKAFGKGKEERQIKGGSHENNFANNQELSNKKQSIKVQGKEDSGIKTEGRERALEETSEKTKARTKSETKSEIKFKTKSETKTEKETKPGFNAKLPASKENQFQDYLLRNIKIGVIGLASGLVAGIFGIGGGAVVVPALSIFTDMSHHSCIGTSLCSMVPAALVGMATHYRNGTYTGNSAPSLSMILRKISKKNILPLLIPLALGSGIGSYVGGKHIAPYVDERSLQLLFAAMMTYLGFGGINKSGVLQRILAKKSK